MSIYTWTEERTNKAIELWREGLSASQIAQRLGGVSRNAVIGRLHRKGEHQRHEALNSNQKRQAARRTYSTLKRKRAAIVQKADPMRAIAIASEPLPVELPPTGKTIAAADRHEGHCQWIYGDVGKEHTYCGCKKLPGVSWCADHVKIVFPNYGMSKPKDRIERVSKLEEA